MREHSTKYKTHWINFRHVILQPPASRGAKNIISKGQAAAWELFVFRGNDTFVCVAVTYGSLVSSFTSWRWITVSLAFFHFFLGSLYSFRHNSLPTGSCSDIVYHASLGYSPRIHDVVSSRWVATASRTSKRHVKLSYVSSSISCSLLLQSRRVSDTLCTTQPPGEWMIEGNRGRRGNTYKHSVKLFTDAQRLYLTFLPGKLKFSSSNSGILVLLTIQRLRIVIFWERVNVA